MNLPNKYAGELLNKDRNTAQRAAKHIINTIDLDAWKCLIDNTDFLFDYIKDRAGKTLTVEVNAQNIKNLFPFLQFHSIDWDFHIANTLAKYKNEEIDSYLINILEKGTNAEKAYAAKYFEITKNENPKISELLFQNAQSDYQPLKTNSAATLGVLHDKTSYNYYINKLNSDDDWEKVDAAQFLSSYGNKEALINILKAMSNSGMAEYLAGEAAILDDVYQYFDSENVELKSLSLECFDNILSGLAEIWQLNVLFEFKVYDCINKLIESAVSSTDKDFSSAYSRLLLKANLKFGMFVENEEYRFDADNNVLKELNEINALLSQNDDEFWDFQVENLICELSSRCEKRKLAAINIIEELNLKFAFDNLYSLINEANQSDIIINESINAIKKLGMIDHIQDKDALIARIQDENISAIVKNLLQ